MNTLLITRPLTQARPLARAAQEAGWHALCLPLFRIKYIGSSSERCEALQARADASWWIFTSVNAVAAARAARPPRWARCAAIGAATARALEEAGHPAEAMPQESYTTEALLALPVFQAVADQHIIIVGNESARPALREQLAERGARVESLPVYRLESIAHDVATVAESVREAGVTVLTSASAADRLWALSDAPTRRRLAQMPLVVPSERVAEHCAHHGLSGAYALAQPMSNAALLAAADTLPIMQKNDDEERGAQVAPPAEATASSSSEADAAERHAATAMPPSGADGDSAAGAPVGPPAAPPAPPAAAPVRGGRGGFWLLFLLWLLLAVAVACGGWWGWQQLEQQEGMGHERIADLEQQLAEQRDSAAGVRRSAREAAGLAGSLEEQLSALDERVSQHDARFTELRDIVDAGRAQAHVVAAEQLLMAASERLQLGRDPEGARQALRLADRRLAALEDPRFFDVREALASEMAALRAVETIDRTALALELRALIARAGNFRLLGGVPDAQAPALSEKTAADADAPAWRRAWHSVREALSSVFVIRRSDVPVQPLMAPEQERLMRSLLMLRLESARAALLAGEAKTFDDAVASAVEWLETRFARSDADVAAAIATLREMRKKELAPTLPDISGSLARLREATRAGEDGGR